MQLPKKGSNILLSLQRDLKSVSGVGPARLKKLHELGLRTMWQLLHHYPSRYDDLRNMKRVVDVVTSKTSDKITLTGRIVSIRNFRSPRRGLMITDAVFSDESGSIRVVWFDQPFLAEPLKAGTHVRLSGVVKIGMGKGSRSSTASLVSPVYEIMRQSEHAEEDIGDGANSSSGIHTGRLVPVYPETAGITSRWLRFVIHRELVPLPDEWDYLPEDMRSVEGLWGWVTAMREIHFPASQRDLERARRRLAFDELLLIQLHVQEKRHRRTAATAIALPFDQEHIKKFIAGLPFQPTFDQKKAAWEILQDFEIPHPMDRLLEGDVGTGKTTVVAIAAAQVMFHGMQTAVVAPTEVLAEQHYKTFLQFFEIFKQSKNARIALLTGSQAMIGSKEVSALKVREGLADGGICVVIGTHALFQERVAFARLAFVAVDEQHRFGVSQRAMLVGKKASNSRKGTTKQFGKKTQPHFLSLSATPIPRTLALSVFGNIAISRLTTFPKGERRVTTKIVVPRYRDSTYGFIRQRLARGEQLFVIVPLIEQSKVLDLKNAQEEFVRLSREVFREYKVGLVHGRLASKEVCETIQKFRDKQLAIVVSTTVIEVGVDIPDASLMIIEGAERFGLAQLHQLRGRIGRNNQEAYCFLFPTTADRANSQRLKALEKNDDGFALAEIDLKLRGPGEFLGERQSGVVGDVRLADLTDMVAVQKSRQWAEALLSRRSMQKTNPDLYKLVASKRLLSYID